MATAARARGSRPPRFESVIGPETRQRASIVLFHQPLGYPRLAEMCVGLVLSGQIGATEGQQTVSPAGTAASETTKGAVAAAGAGEAVSAEAVTANVANLFTSLTPVIASALAAAISQTIAALVPVVVTASGGASTPSQTQPKAA